MILKMAFVPLGKPAGKTYAAWQRQVARYRSIAMPLSLAREYAYASNSCSARRKRALAAKSAAGKDDAMTRSNECAIAPAIPKLPARNGTVVALLLPGTRAR